MNNTPPDSVVQRDLLICRLLDVLGTLRDLRDQCDPGQTQCDIIRLMNDGQWRTGAMIARALRPAARIYLAGYEAAGVLTAVSVGRKKWYRRSWMSIL